MGKINQSGFSAIETLLILIVLAIIGGAGYYVYHANKNTSKTLNAAAQDSSGSPKFASKPKAKAVSGPYTGWKSYTLKYEKLAFKYPSSWKLQDDTDSSGLSPNTDSISFTTSDNFFANIDDGWDGSGDSLNLDIANPLAVKFLGSRAYLVFSHPRMATLDGLDPSSLGGATLMLRPSDQYGQGSTQGYFPQDKYAHGDSNVNNGGSTMLIGGGYSTSTKTFPSLDQAVSDYEIKNLILLVQSMHY